MNIKKLIKCSCILSAFLLIVGICFITILMPEKLLSFREMRSVKRIITNSNYNSIGFTGVTKGKYDGYEFDFEIYDRSSDNTLDEALDCYTKMLDYIAENDMSLNNKVITFRLREKNESGPGTIEISNYCKQTDSFDFRSVRYVSVHCCSTDLSPLERCTETINYISISDIPDLKMPDLTTFSKLKDVDISNCTDDNGNTILSDTMSR